jgi:hypothetical protein
MKFCKALNKIQFINWFIVCALIFYFIFVTGTNPWYLTLKIGLSIQLILLATNWVLGIKSNSRWAIYDLVLALMIVFTELENYNLFRTDIFKGEGGFAMTYLFIFIVNIGFLISIRQIIYEFKTITA